MSKGYLNIAKHYENCFEKYGDSHLGVDWPNQEDVFTRYNVMLDLIQDKSENISLLDFGCGAGHLYDYIIKEGLSRINYSGLDVSQKFIDLCLKKYPDKKFLCADILEDSEKLPIVDYTIMNGVFTEKLDLSYEEMFTFFKKILLEVYKKTRKGLAFNVMSKFVDWEREDLFHLSFDDLGNFLTSEVNRNFIIRNDYGLYEYSVYIYK